VDFYGPGQMNSKTTSVQKHIGPTLYLNKNASSLFVDSTDKSQSL